MSERLPQQEADQFDLYPPAETQKQTAVADLPRPYLFSRHPVPKISPVFAAYWEFAKKRQQLFFCRLFQNRSLPFQDPILDRYRFTNAYRASDRVSQYLIRHVLYDQSWSPSNLLFRLLIFKFFNKIETWQALSARLGRLTWEGYDFEAYDKCLTDLMLQGQTIYSAAYIMASGETAFGYARKHQNHLRVIEQMMQKNVADRLADQPNLGSVFSLLCKFPCVGSFLGYQLAIDINYTTLTQFSEDDFVEPGPGALDGIAKCFYDIGEYTPADIIRYMVDVQEAAFEKFAGGFPNLWGRRLHLIDCQNIFCEVSKYSRVAYPSLVGVSNRSRIKQIYRASQLPLERPWYPPKWGINEAISADYRWYL